MSTQPNADALSLLSDLQRYSGWLARDRASVTVRADVTELATALQAGTDVWSCLQVLDKDIQRLPGGGIRTMLRRALRGLETALAPNEIDGKNVDALAGGSERREDGLRPPSRQSWD